MGYVSEELDAILDALGGLGVIIPEPRLRAIARVQEVIDQLGIETVYDVTGRLAAMQAFSEATSTEDFVTDTFVGSMAAALNACLFEGRVLLFEGCAEPLSDFVVEVSERPGLIRFGEAVWTDLGGVAEAQDVYASWGTDFLDAADQIASDNTRYGFLVNAGRQWVELLDIEPFREDVLASSDPVQRLIDLERAMEDVRLQGTLLRDVLALGDSTFLPADFAPPSRQPNTLGPYSRAAFVRDLAAIAQASRSRQAQNQLARLLKGIRQNNNAMRDGGGLNRGSIYEVTVAGWLLRNRGGDNPDIVVSSPLDVPVTIEAGPNAGTEIRKSSEFDIYLNGRVYEAKTSTNALGRKVRVEDAGPGAPWFKFTRTALLAHAIGVSEGYSLVSPVPYDDLTPTLEAEVKELRDCVFSASPPAGAACDDRSGVDWDFRYETVSTARED